MTNDAGDGDEVPATELATGPPSVKDRPEHVARGPGRARVHCTLSVKPRDPEDTPDNDVRHPDVPQ